jgi:hypothetical protein
MKILHIGNVTRKIITKIEAGTRKIITKIEAETSEIRNFLLTLSDESGSAIVEFVLLAIPLLIPIMIYLGAVRENSSINSDLYNLARQSARAFITSSNESYESARLQSVLQTFESRVFHADGIEEIPTVSVECSATPCLTPDSRVKVTASLEHHQKNMSGIFRFISTPTQQFTASDIQIVDAWR